MAAPALGSSRLRLGFALVFAVGCLATAAGADDAPQPQPTATAAALTPEKIYLRAIHAMKDAPQPPFVTFREHVVGRNFTLRCDSDGMNATFHHGDVIATYDVWFRTSDGSALSQPVGVASAKPCPATLLTPAGSAVASLGLPQASPTPGSAPTGGAPDSQIGPPIIAAVRVDGAFYYHIDLVGLEKLGANDVYHLKLRAYRDPDTHPLTDLYVDPATFLVREARGEVAGHYVIASGRFAGVIDFDRVGAYWLVQREHFEIAANALLVHARMMATIDGSDFTTPSELPGIAFPTPRPTPTPKATPA
jgi:hypothetical protein